MRSLIIISITWLLFSECDRVVFSPPRINYNTTTISDTFYGEILNDRYRNIENIEDSSIIGWLKEYENYSKSIIRSITNRKKIIEYQNSYQNNLYRPTLLKITPNDYYFYLKGDSISNKEKLYYKIGYTGKEEMIYDPMHYKIEKNSDYVINYISPNYKGSKVVISLTKNGEEISEAVILDVNSKQIHPGIITHCMPANFGIEWLQNNNAFIYNYFPVIDKSSPNFLLNSESVLYKLGSDPNVRNTIFSKRTHPKLGIKSSEFPIIWILSPNSKYLYAGISGSGGVQSVYTKKISTINNSEWKILFDSDMQIVDFYELGDDLIYMSSENADNYKILKIKLSKPDFQNPELLVAEDPDAVIDDMAVTKQGLFYVKVKNGVESNLYCYKNGKSKLIEIPKKSGSISLSSSSSSEQDKLWINITGWTTRNERYRYDYKKDEFIPENLYKLKHFPVVDTLVKGKKVYKISDNASVANLYLGKSFEALGNYSESIHCFSSVDTFLQTTNHVSPELLEAYPPLINYCANNKDYKKQLYYTNNLLKFDSIADLNQQYLSLNIRSKYDVPELIKIKEELTKRLKLEQTLSRRNLLLLLLGLVVSLGIVLYYAKRSIVYKKRYRDLISKNNEKQGLQKTLDTGLSTAGSIVIPDEIVNTILRQLDEFEKSYGFSSKSCSLHHLAKEFNTNSKYLSKVINYKKGLNFSNYINNLRIDYAIKRLTNEAHFRTFTIEAIAEDIGFNKAQSYSTAFHKKTGIYPSYFIKQLEKQQTFE